MAAEMGISEAGTPHLARPWLKTDLLKNFKINKDKRFVEKLEDIVGLYLNPPEHAFVICVDAS